MGSSLRPGSGRDPGHFTVGRYSALGMRSSAEYPGGTLIGGMSHVEAILALHAGRYDRGGHKMAPDAEIQKFVQRHHGFIPKTGSIAHVKEVHGIPTLRRTDRARHERDVELCPQEKREAIEEALRHFGVI